MTAWQGKVLGGEVGGSDQGEGPMKEHKGEVSSEGGEDRGGGGRKEQEAREGLKN